MLSKHVFSPFIISIVKMPFSSDKCATVAASFLAPVIVYKS